MAYNELRRALIAKTKWSRQTLSAKAKALREQTPMSTETAQAILAHRLQIPLHKYLDAVQLRQVQEALSHITAPKFSASRPAPATWTKHGRPLNSRFPKQVRASDPLLESVALTEAREMALVYPILYVIENSMRQLVKRVMTSKYGTDWWNSALTGGKVKGMRDRAETRLAKEDQMHWHQRRGAHPIDYIDLKDLRTIFDAKQEDFFPDVLGDCKDWFDQFMRELEPSRNVVCHMNPLAKHNIAGLKVKGDQWYSLVTGRLANIPPSKG